MGNTDTKALEWTNGMRILKMKHDSPAEKAGLQPFQDFIVDVLPESQAFELARDFTGFVSQHEDKEVNLLVLNCFTGDCRAVKITPTRKWTNADSLLGLKLRLENIENAVNSVCRVTKIFPGSPGASSGIVEDRDYMIGCLQYEYGSVEEFSDKIKVLFDIEADPSLDLYVVDIGTLQGRYVRVKPSNLWKGDGLLGLEFGAGMFDSRTLRDFLEKAAKTANLSVIPMNSHGDHQAMAIQNHDKHSNSANDTSLSLQMNSSSHTGENTIQEGNNGGQHAQLYMPECCYFERKDAKENTYRIKASSLLPALQFPLRQFVYKA